MKLKNLFFVAGACIVYAINNAACDLPNSGTSVWSIAAEDLFIDCEAYSKVTIIDSKIDALDLCGAVSIGNEGIELVTPGLYCLAEDLQGTVTIAASDVTFDLNGHVIEGTITTAPNTALENITIKNGVIQVPTSPTGLDGITISGIDANSQAQNIFLQDLAIYCNGDCMNSTGGSRGIAVDYALHVIVSGVYTIGALFANLQIDNSENVLIERSDFVLSCSVGVALGSNGLVTHFRLINSSFNENVSCGLECTNVSNGNLSSCIFAQNDIGACFLANSESIVVTNCFVSTGGVGYQVRGNSQNVTFEGCQAVDEHLAFGIYDDAKQVSVVACRAHKSRPDIAGGTGFIISGNAQGVSLIACQSYEYNNGYEVLQNAHDICFVECQARNGTGFGFFITVNSALPQNVQNVTLTKCTAKSNVQSGFGIGIGTRYVFLTECFAFGNSLHGFAVSNNSQNVNLRGCQAIENTGNGFSILGTASAKCINCISDGNAGSGFNIVSTAVGTFKECAATRNMIFGFRDAAGASSLSRYAACYAQGNTTNYSPLGAPYNQVAATTAGISYWNNTFLS